MGSPGSLSAPQAPTLCRALGWYFAFLLLKPFKSSFVANVNVRRPRWRRGKESVRQCRRRKRLGIPGSGRSRRGGNGIPLQYCLENSMDRGT